MMLLWLLFGIAAADGASAIAAPVAIAVADDAAAVAAVATACY